MCRITWRAFLINSLSDALTSRKGKASHPLRFNAIVSLCFSWGLLEFSQIQRSWKTSPEKQITSPGWMHETSAQGWCTGKTQRDGMEREAGGGIGMGNTCKSMADSCQWRENSKTFIVPCKPQVTGSLAHPVLYCLSFFSPLMEKSLSFLQSALNLAPNFQV